MAGSAAAWAGTFGVGLSNAAETRSAAALSAGDGDGTVAVGGSERSVWGGTEAAVDSSRSERSRPNTLRSKLRMPMGEAFRMS